MERNYTSVEQSKRLLDLGVDSESADMCYLSQYRNDNGEYTYFLRPTVKGKDVEQYYISSMPSWSVGALMELLKNRSDCNFVSLDSNRANKWRISTSYYKMANWKSKDVISDTQIDVCYNMVVWLLENEVF